MSSPQYVLQSNIELLDKTQLRSVKPFWNGKVFVEDKSDEDYDYVSHVGHMSSWES